MRLWSCNEFCWALSKVCPYYNRYCVIMRDGRIIGIYVNETRSFPES